MTIQFANKDARWLYLKACEHLTGQQKTRFKIECDVRYEAKITGVDLPEFKLEKNDVYDALFAAGVLRPELLTKKL